MNYLSNITEIFVKLDDFMIEFNKQIAKYQLSDNKKRRHRKSTLSTSEVITILVLFHLSQYKNFKHFYLYYLHHYMKDYFPKLVSYNRFVELMQQAIIPMGVYLNINTSEQCTGISFVDSTKIQVCHNKRNKRNKVFAGIANVGKSTMGWFFGFKLHLVCNGRGELLNFALTEASIDDRQPLIAGNLMKSVWGKVFGDKGYISQDLFNKLFVDGIQLITNIRNKILPRKRSIIETINDSLPRHSGSLKTSARLNTQDIDPQLTFLLIYYLD